MMGPSTEFPNNTMYTRSHNIFKILGIEPVEGEERELHRLFPQSLPLDAQHALQRIQFIDRIYCRWIESKLNASINHNANNIGDAIDIGISETYE